MKVLSLFDGIGVSYQALKQANIPVSKYYASEVDKYAMKVANLNHPDIIQVGDVKNLKAEDVGGAGNITLMLFGVPCQDLSSLGKGAGLQGERSGLFFEALRILQDVKPKYWVMENVASMRKTDRDKISKLLQVEPQLLPSSLVSAQCRKRLYWHNIPGVTAPKEKGIQLQDILVDGYSDRSKAHAVLTNQLPETAGGLNRYLFKCTGQLAFKEKYFSELDKKTKSERFQNMEKLGLTPEATPLYKNGVFRHLNVHELEALQTLPKDYTAGISTSQRFKCLGNSFTCDVIAHILKHIPNNERT